MISEQALGERLQADADDLEAALALCALLLEQGRPVPLPLQEASLRHHLAADPSRDDLSFRLAMVLMEQGREVPSVLEERALRHAMAANPGRLDLADRYIAVALETVLAGGRGEDTAAVVGDPRGIVARARARLAALRAEEARADLPSFGVRWGAYAARMHAAIDGFTSPVEALRYAQQRVGFEHRLPAGQGLRHYALYRRELESEFAHYAAHLIDFDDPPGSAPETSFPIEGRQVSNIVPYLARIVLTCLTELPEPPRIVLELGGGYGAPARTWLTNPVAPARSYIIVDIAESLFFADCMLSDVFGPDAVHYVVDRAPLDPALLDRHPVILCPVERLDALEALPVDLVVNTGSLQEMSEAWVDHYMAWLDRQRVRFFYSLNYAAQPLGFLAESINLWSPRPSASWMARLLRWNPGLLRMQADRNFLEALYEKTPAALAPEEAAARLAMLGERGLVGQVLCECLDMFRRFPRPEVALPVLRRAMAEMPFRPKEALWLAEWLCRVGSGLATADRAEVEAYRVTLEAERAGGIEGTT